VVNAYVQPRVEEYLSAIRDGFTGMAKQAPIFVMKSTGGLTTLAEAQVRPVEIIESGPAAGVVAAAAMGKALGKPNLLTFDMGGTTAKASIIENGHHFSADELDVGAEITRTGTALAPLGLTISLPSILIAEVGAGGGSIAWIDEGGALHVGPRSAGADPGPACYGRGGQSATVTDADLVLGYLGASTLGLRGEQIELRPELAERSLETQIKSASHLNVLELAWGIFTVSNARMAKALRAVTIERGRDPKDFEIVVFGGAGPLHGAAVADMLGISRIVVPVFPGVFSALGILLASHDHEVIRSDPASLASLDGSKILDHFVELDGRLGAVSSSRATDASRQRTVAMCYSGQSSTLPIALPNEIAPDDLVGHLVAAFQHEHERTYGYVSDEAAIEIAEYRLRKDFGAVSSDYRQLSAMASDAREPTSSSQDMYFGPSLGWQTVPVLSRWDLTGDIQKGPLAVDDVDTTVLVPPRWHARRDNLGNLHLGTDTHEKRS
jgi:N-methylhydantoinase A